MPCLVWRSRAAERPTCTCPPEGVAAPPPPPPQSARIHTLFPMGPICVCPPPYHHPHAQWPRKHASWGRGDRESVVRANGARPPARYLQGRPATVRSRCVSSMYGSELHRQHQWVEVRVRRVFLHSSVLCEGAPHGAPQGVRSSSGPPGRRGDAVHLRHPPSGEHPAHDAVLRAVWAPGGHVPEAWRHAVLHRVGDGGLPWRDGAKRVGEAVRGEW